MSREYAGGVPAISGCESNGDGWAIISSDPGGALGDGVLNVNQVELVPVGVSALLISITPLRVGVNPVTKKRHFRVEVYDGDGIDRESFCHWRAIANSGTAGATGYAYRSEVGHPVWINRRGLNGLQVWCRGYADGGHVRALVKYRRGV